MSEILCFAFVHSFLTAAIISLVLTSFSPYCKTISVLISFFAAVVFLVLAVVFSRLLPAFPQRLLPSLLQRISLSLLLRLSLPSLLQLQPSLLSLLLCLRRSLRCFFTVFRVAIIIVPSLLSNNNLPGMNLPVHLRFHIISQFFFIVTLQLCETPGFRPKTV